MSLSTRLATASLVAALLWTCADLAMAAPPAPPFMGAAERIAPARALPAVPLKGPGGRPFELAELRGKWVWLYVGFANCPGACPLAMDFMGDAYRRLARPAAVQPVFFSVDPARDTPAAIGKFVAYYDRAFLGLTGERGAIDALTRGLGARYEIYPPSKPGGDYVVGHPNVVYVLDPEGRLVATYDPSAPDAAAKLAADADGWPAARPIAAQPPFQPQTPPPTPSPAPVAAATEPPPPLPDTASAWCGLGPASYAELAMAPLMTRSRTLGSGTTVLPALSPMRMWAVVAADWLWMFHGEATLGLNRQGGPRGVEDPGTAVDVSTWAARKSPWWPTTYAAENWLMAMASRFLGPGILDLRAMTSLEPFTLPPGGTPQLFQAGETWRYQYLIDRQHPHDLFMELAARYTWNLDARTSFFMYGGPAGEPALGPGAFMHRPSAADNRWAPLGHHMQDAGHIAYGVATAGARRDDLQIEASLFNGREPDEDRLDFDFGPMDSWATRLTWFPGASWALQASHGLLNEPEVLYAGDVYRTTASATYVSPFPWGRLSTMLVWGQNLELHRAQPMALQSYGLEGQADFASGDHAYGRYELVDRAGLVEADLLARRVNALTLGWVRDIGPMDRLALGIGADATVYSVDSGLAGAYGTNPVSFRVYLRARPPAMRPSNEPPAGS